MDVGKEQLAETVVVSLCHPCPPALGPHSVNDDFPWLCYSWDRWWQCAHASWCTCLATCLLCPVHSCKHHLESPCVSVSHERKEHVRALLLRQPLMDKACLPLLELLACSSSFFTLALLPWVQWTVRQWIIPLWGLMGVVVIFHIVLSSFVWFLCT